MQPAFRRAAAWALRFACLAGGGSGHPVAEGAHADAGGSDATPAGVAALNLGEPPSAASVPTPPAWQTVGTYAFETAGRTMPIVVELDLPAKASFDVLFAMAKDYGSVAARVTPLLTIDLETYFLGGAIVWYFHGRAFVPSAAGEIFSWDPIVGPNPAPADAAASARPARDPAAAAARGGPRSRCLGARARSAPCRSC